MTCDLYIYFPTIILIKQIMVMFLTILHDKLISEIQFVVRNSTSMSHRVYQSILHCLGKRS